MNSHGCKILRFFYPTLFEGDYQQLRGFVYTYHPAAPGSNPKHTIIAFFMLKLKLYCCLDEKRSKIKGKEAGIGPY